MNRFPAIAAFLWVSLLSCGVCPALEPVADSRPQAPPTPPPIVTRKGVTTNASTDAQSFGMTLYSIGTPTDDEQYYLELLNRARANPPAEGARLATTTNPDVLSALSYYGVDLTMLQTEFNAIASAPPLSLSAALISSARGHSDWMLANAVQSHTGAGGSDPGTRMTNAGYNWTTYGENIFSYSKSDYYGHAGFEIDWGTGTGGMQGPPRGHRVNIHNASFREVGVGITTGSNTLNGNTVGPQLVTQDFATASGATPFVTGVVYYDLNGNNFYDPGEGIGGVTVNVQGSNYYAVTASSGGYSIPVPLADGVQTVTFSGAGFNLTTSATVANLQNVKVDFVPAYSPPVISGTATLYSGAPGNFTFNAVGGATQYGWQYAQKLPAAAENCEDLSNVTTSTSPGYSVVDTTVKDSGAASFHLAQPTFVTQTITFNKTYYPQSGSILQFKSRLGWATPTQVAHVQVSLDGLNWVDVYTQNGTNSQGETGFTARSISLTNYAGQFINIRFAYTMTSSGYPQTSAGVGWYIDTVTFTNTSELGSSTAVGPIASPAFSFTPPATGTYLLSARPYISGRYWSYGPVKEVNAQAATGYAGWVATLHPEVTEGPLGDHDRDGLSNLVEYAFGLDPSKPTASSVLPQPVLQSGQWQVSYTAPASVTGVTYGVEWSSDLLNWNPLTDTGSGNVHTFSVSAAGQSKMFFRHKIILLP